MDELKEKIRNGKVLFGTHICNADMFNVDLIGQMGFDYLWIDGEHTEIEKKDVQKILLANRAAGGKSKAFVRVSEINPNIVKPILDMGADGIIFPMVRCKKDVDLAVASCLYPPKGIRGFSPKGAVNYGVNDINEYINTAGEKIWKLIQIETKEAYESLDEITSNPYVDAYIIGPADTSGAFGHLTDYKHPEVIGHIKDAIERVKKIGKPIAVSVGTFDYETARFWMELGVDMISMGTEFGFIMKGCKETIEVLKKAYQSIHHMNC